MELFEILLCFVLDFVVNFCLSEEGGGRRNKKKVLTGPVQTKGLVNLPDFLPNCCL